MANNNGSVYMIAILEKWYFDCYMSKKNFKMRSHKKLYIYILIPLFHRFKQFPMIQFVLNFNTLCRVKIMSADMYQNNILRRKSVSFEQELSYYYGMPG